MRFVWCGLAVIALAGCGGSSGADQHELSMSSVSSVASSDSSSVSLSSAISSSFSSSESSSSLSSDVASSSSSSSEDDRVDYSALTPSEPTDAPLTRLSGEDFERLVKNGLRLQVGTGYDDVNVGRLDGVDFSPAPPEADVANDNYSDTNVHVEGVGEADVAKYDGRHWFVAYRPNSYNGELPGIQVVATDPDIPDAAIAGTYGFDDGAWGAAYSLYLQKDNGAASHVVALRSQWGLIDTVLPGWGPEIAVDAGQPLWPGPANSELKVEFIDVNQPSSPELVNSISLGGTLIDSRRVGDTLYLVTRFDPWLETLLVEDGSSQTREGNEAVLSSTELADLLPKYRQGETEEPLSMDCYAEGDTGPEHGFFSLVNITAIDMVGQRVLSSECLSTGVDSMTMSPNALYLTASDWRDSEAKTTIHKFDLTDIGASYSATGRVAGSVRADAPYRVNEHEDLLRVVTSRGVWGDVSHHLTVLRQSGSGFEVVSELPNDERPEPIGKPGEDIFAVRFAGDTAYVVTFRRIDPLYVLDLSDGADPKITGELEVPGFATYIHPINENYLFTLGQDADNQTGWTKGIKAQLVEIDEGRPTLAGELLIGDQGSGSDALRDLRALNFLETAPGELRVSFPVSVTQKTGPDYAQWQYSGLQMLTLSGLDGDGGELQDSGTLIAESAGSNRHDTGGGVRRGLLHDEAVFYAHDNRIWFGQWGAADTPQGPIGGEPIACTQEIRYGLNVELWSGGDDVDVCSAEVIATDGDYSETLQPQTAGAWQGGCQFLGAPERAGRYSITAELDGYARQTQSGIKVSEDVCHVQTRWVWFNLTSEE